MAFEVSKQLRCQKFIILNFVWKVREVRRGCLQRFKCHVIMWIFICFHMNLESSNIICLVLFSFRLIFRNWIQLRQYKKHMYLPESLKEKKTSNFLINTTNLGNFSLQIVSNPIHHTPRQPSWGVLGPSRLNPPLIKRSFFALPPKSSLILTDYVKCIRQCWT